MPISRCRGQEPAGRRTWDLNNVASDLIDVLIGEAIFDVMAHDVADLGIWPLALGYATDRDVTIGDHSDQPIISTDRKNMASMSAIIRAAC